MTLRVRFARALLVVLFALGISTLPAFAQEATISGTITDATGGVLPGVTITATHQATGNNFVVVTDERGAFRLGVRTGLHTITAQLQGFATVTRTVELLVNQDSIVNLQMSPSTLAETITVTGESPLVETTKSTMSSNIDPRQMQELPVNGRNWVQLSLLAVGNRANTVTETPLAGGVDFGFQVNVDGQQETQVVSTAFGQPKYSQDAIAEFEFVSSRFDATQGRSSGVQINAITKSGTNRYAGTLAGYFRDDKFNAPEFLTGKKVPFANQLVSTTFGGPIVRNRFHFFGSYEYEREPSTQSFTTPWPSFNLSFTDARIDKKGSARLDYQLSPQRRLTVRGNKFVGNTPIEPISPSTTHPSSILRTTRYSNDLAIIFTQVLSNAAVLELRGGYAGYYWTRSANPQVHWPDFPMAWAKGIGAPIINLTGFTVGQGHANAPQRPRMDSYPIFGQTTLSFSGHGRHEMKIGGEFLDYNNGIILCNTCMGVIDARGGPVPANIEQLFPVWNEASTWNLAALTPITRSYTTVIGDPSTPTPRKAYASWVQDNWTMGRLTLNLGLRYDLASGIWGETVSLPPFFTPHPSDKNNWGPRIGFAYSLSDATVIRGGVGKYYGDVIDVPALFAYLAAKQANLQLFPDGRPDFTANPFNGPRPTLEQARQLIQQRGTLKTLTGIPGPNNISPYSWQGSIGMQRQLGPALALQADYVYSGSRHQIMTRDINIAFNPATGVNYPFTDTTKRPYAGYGTVSMQYNNPGLELNYHRLQFGLTKRLSHRWQASANYLLGLEWQRDPGPLNPGCENPTTWTAQTGFTCDVAVTLPYDLASAYYRTDAQRHRVVVNAIWDVGYGFQASGLYFFGDQGKATPTSGVDVRQLGAAGGLVRRDGTFIQRGSFDKKAFQRVDARLQRKFRISDRFTVDGVFEVFNVFNRANFETWVVNEASAAYGQPQTSTNFGFRPRTIQLGLRTTF